MTNLINNVIEIGPKVLEKVSKVVNVFHNNLPLEKDMMQRHSFNKKKPLILFTHGYFVMIFIEIYLKASVEKQCKYEKFTTTTMTTP